MRHLILNVIIVLGMIAHLGLTALAETPANEALVSKARALEGRGRPELAVQTWQQVLLADPNHQEALVALARFARQNGKTPESQAYLDRLRKLNPNHPALQQVQAMPVLVQQQARLKEAARLAANQQFDQAMQIYRQVFGDEPPPGAMAIAYYETQSAVPGGWESATAGLQKLMETYPAIEDYRLLLGKLWTYRPATRLAGMRLLESIKGGPEAINRARQAWRQALVWEGSNPQVASSLRAYLAKYPDPELSRMLENVSASQNAQVQPGAVRPAAEHLGYTALKANKVKEAELLFENSLKENPKSPGALAGLGFVRMKQENFSAAASLFESAAAESPKDKDIADALETARFWSAMKEASDSFATDRVEDAAGHYRRALAMRASSPEALQGLGGVLMKMKDAAAAAPLFEKLTEQQPQNDEAWYQLLNARYFATGADSTLAASRLLPNSVRFALARNVNYLALMSTASSDTGKNDDSKRFLHEAIELANAKGLVLSTPQQLQFAGLYLRHGYASEAAAVFQKVVDAHPDNVDAWEGLLSALIQTHEEGRASRAVDRMPSAVYQATVSRPSSLRSLAAISTSLGQLDDAEKYLEKSIRLDSRLDDASNTAARLQLAHIWLAQNRHQQAESLLRGMISSHPENPDAWKAFIAALHQQGRDELALKEDSRIPQTVHAVLTDDPDYVSLIAASVNGTGRYDEALRLVRRASALLKQQNRAVPAGLDVQLGWLLLNTNGDERELYGLLGNLGARADLTPAQQHSVSELWSTWSLRRAAAATGAGDNPRAVAILEAASRLLPKDTAIRSSLAGALLHAGESAKALNVYKAWGLADAGAADYAGAIGAAMAAGEMNSSTLWLRTALNRWPGNPELLTLAGKVAAAKGDYKSAQTYWKAALVATPAPAETTSSRTALPALKPADSRPPSEVMGELLLGGPLPKQAPAVVLPVAWRGNRPGGEVPEGARPAIVDVSAKVLPRPGVLAGLPTERESLPVVAVDSSGALPALNPATPMNYAAVEPSPEVGKLRGEIEERLSAIEARNSSYFGSGGSIRGRNGELGFDRMMLEEANIEASHVLGGGLRVSIIAHPTYIDAGTPDGQSDKRFGLLPKGSTYEAQSAGGVGGELQLSTRTFGLRVGMTPRSFLVSNIFAGIRFRPGNGPITILAQREAMRDSMLSFAGVRDPVTNRVWGGVVANTFSVLGNWGGAKSGFYTSFGYQNITGRQVQTNMRLDGNAGMYWRVLETGNGKLIAGFNLMGMHYDKNLRFFTLGHGGYFSPQQYILASVPVQWRGVYNRRIQYSIDASLGSQHFAEEAAPYFPTLSVIQGRNGPYYPKQAATGANYSVEAQTSIQLTPFWYIVTFANVNNSRSYSSATAGVSIRYTTRPRSIDQDFGVPSIPDWRGVQPFRLY